MVGQFIEVYKDFWRHFFDIRGRTSLSQFLGMIWWNLIIYLLIIGYILVYRQKEGAIFGIFVFVIYSIAAVIPLITLLFRRYQDVGISGWWQLLTGFLPLILFWIKFIYLPNLSALVISGTILLLINLILLLLPRNLIKF